MGTASAVADPPRGWTPGANGITGPVTDWSCPSGATPPADPWNPASTKCKIARYQWIDTTQLPIGVNGTVNLDLVFQAVGTPVVQKDLYGKAPDEILCYSELWSTANVWAGSTGSG